jgi:hypothetical protein
VTASRCAPVVLPRRVLQPLPPAPDKAYDPSTYRGRVGAYAGQIHEVRWGYYKGWPHGQVRRAIVRKRWFQVVLDAGTDTLLLRIQDNGTLGTGRALLLNRETGAVLALSQQAAPLRKLVVGPDAGEGTKAFLRAGEADVQLTREKGASAWTLGLRWGVLQADLTLESTGAPTPSIVIGEARPPLEHRPALTQRAPLLRVSGSASVAGRALPVSDAFAEVTYYNAFLPKLTRGRVLSAHGLVTGRPAALACTRGDLHGEQQEATLFVDGQPYALGRLELLDDGRVRGDGLVLGFTPRAVHSADERRMGGRIHHQSTWTAGQLDGEFTLPSGECAAVSWPALLEDHRLLR